MEKLGKPSKSPLRSPLRQLRADEANANANGKMAKKLSMSPLAAKSANGASKSGEKRVRPSSKNANARKVSKNSKVKRPQKENEVDDIFSLDLDLALSSPGKSAHLDVLDHFDPLSAHKATSGATRGLRV